MEPRSTLPNSLTDTMAIQWDSAVAMSARRDACLLSNPAIWFSCRGRAKWFVSWPTPKWTHLEELAWTDCKFSSQRLAKWFTTLSPKEKAKIIKDVTQLVLSRRTRMCNFLEYKGTTVTLARREPDLLTSFNRLQGRLSSLCLPLLHRRMLIDR